MIPICDDQESSGARACPGYAAGMPRRHALARSSPAVACRCWPGGISRSTRVPRYPSDMSDAEWAVTEPTLPVPAWKQGKGGRPAGHCRRDIVDAIRYLVKEGICWRAMPGLPALANLL